MTFAVEYNARTWAENHTDEEVREEMERCENTALTHNYKWNQVGSAHHDYSRTDALRKVLEERKVAS